MSHRHPLPSYYNLESNPKWHVRQTQLSKNLKTSAKSSTYRRHISFLLSSCQPANINHLFSLLALVDACLCCCNQVNYGSKIKTGRVEYSSRQPFVWMQRPGGDRHQQACLSQSPYFKSLAQEELEVCITARIRVLNP
ncbi:hypothetical protein NC653_002441 [Populus alba x Populus x berolinensis]|uniref:Uncharacterized protein n=1 Tax=Populus alba x Populus x berolinensis TaxID=444605 RepID=A0AAD6RQ49_9ROSI|nr:hypothetical protein NC653_002441 [Populus alba x Populus x berolinensis]